VSKIFTTSTVKKENGEKILEFSTSINQLSKRRKFSTPRLRSPVEKGVEKTASISRKEKKWFQKDKFEKRRTFSG